MGIMGWFMWNTIIAYENGNINFVLFCQGLTLKLSMGFILWYVWDPNLGTTELQIARIIPVLFCKPRNTFIIQKAAYVKTAN